jgi:hypothetical protein
MSDDVEEAPAVADDAPHADGFAGQPNRHAVERAREATPEGQEMPLRLFVG